jgi:hypothetical protein
MTKKSFVEFGTTSKLGGKDISAIQFVKGLDVFATTSFSGNYSPNRGCDPMTYETFQGIYEAELDSALIGGLLRL